MTRAGRRGNPGLLPEDLASGGVSPHGQTRGDASSVPQKRGTWAGPRISSLISGDHPRSAALCSGLHTPGNDEGAAGSVCVGVVCYVAVCNRQAAPLPFPLVNTPTWTGPSSHPTLLCHCLFTCLSATSECTLHGAGIGPVSFGARVFQAFSKYRLCGLMNKLVCTYLV